MTAQVEAVEACAYRIPTDGPEADGTLTWDSTTLVVAQVSAAGATGLGWTYASAPAAAYVTSVLGPVLLGRDAFDVPAAWSAMVRRLRNDSRQGIAGYALSAVDVALWDLKAKLLGVPLHRLFGAALEAVPVYGSGGFTSYTEARLVEQLAGWAEQGIPRMKIKIGAADTSDSSRIEAARTVTGALYVDANGAYTAKEALRTAARLAEYGVTWFEEPVSSDDLAGLRLVRDNATLDVAAGEYGSDLAYFARMCAAGAVDCLQIDATRCGGYTEWFRAAAVAAAHGLEVSAHCAPNLHAPAALATVNTRHVEWFHDHVRIESLLFDGAADPTGGTIRPADDRPGHGLSFRPDMSEPYLLGGSPR